MRQDRKKLEVRLVAPPGLVTPVSSLIGSNKTDNMNCVEMRNMNYLK